MSDEINIIRGPCCCGPSSPAQTVIRDKTIDIDYLFLDQVTCDRCRGSREVLEKALGILGPVFKLAGYEVRYRCIEMTDRQTASEYGLLSSPTIRVNGHDICRSVEENSCDCCSDIAGGTPVDCRVFEYEGGKYEVIPEAMMYEEILRYALAEKVPLPGDYEMPENLVAFFDGKEGMNNSG